MRYRMNKIIKLLESENYSAVKALIKNQKYLKALKTLEKCNVITCIYGDDELCDFMLNDGDAAVYALSREDVWNNRIIGFIFGVGTSLLTAFITGSLQHCFMP